MINRISLSSFAFLTILLSLRIELCYGLRFDSLWLILIIVPNLLIFCIIISCVCYCCYFKYKKENADSIAVETISRPTATHQNRVNNRTSNSSISSAGHRRSPRRTRSSRCVDNTHSSNQSPQRTVRELGRVTNSAPQYTVHTLTTNAIPQIDISHTPVTYLTITTHCVNEDIECPKYSDLEFDN